MARTARVMLAGCPFHVTHRGNQRRPIFERELDRAAYLAILRRYARRFGMAVWAYCLMPNHVHLIVTGAEVVSIPKAIGNAHRGFARRRNLRLGVTGHLWANRYYSSALDETHLWAAVRYAELNPVRAGLVPSPLDHPWSSARCHAGLEGSSLLDPSRPFPGPIRDWGGWLALGIEDELARRIRRNTSRGRPTGNDAFVRSLGRRFEGAASDPESGTDG